jgi:LacI family transcriptional regulator
VARLAGVSPGTVSKALNGRGALSLGTIQRIQQAAEQLGYQPNALARGLLAGRTFTVGLITTDSFGGSASPSCRARRTRSAPGASRFSCAIAGTTRSGSSTTCAPCSNAGSTASS